MSKVDFKYMRHEDFYQSAIKALDAALEYDEACAREQTSLLIAIVDLLAALYLLQANKFQIDYELIRDLAKKKYEL